MQSTLRDVSGIIQFQFLLEANILAAYFFMSHFKILEEKLSITEFMDLTETLPVFSLFSLTYNPIQPFSEHMASPNPSKYMWLLLAGSVTKQSYRKVREKLLW